MSASPRARAVNVERLDEAGFQNFGRAIVSQRGDPTSSGEGYRCWFGVADLDGDGYRVGQVRAQMTGAPVTHMERHADAELLLAVTHPVVQLVAPASNDDSLHPQPDAARARAFLIEPGEAVLISAQTWHAAALPVSENTLYYFAARPDCPGSGFGVWTPFKDQEEVEVCWNNTNPTDGRASKGERI